ncbi:DUF2164 domain-containing protein [Pelagicoccus sp. SDUM812005]|uniref:DUF2164 domain-containing protein n=1 Tax=Pelagicoccus sp. SDUM812005 TaxID=3041257 RepID=UPI00280E8FD4|nr:DUF2164 domain-containing protein [Pelagicoccus sp. SDUM812005]MDQ8183324.1 DUF2164 domain-containing protein [Pelagicoccus sp. SDUM812005]
MPITLNKEQMADAIPAVQRYVEEELDLEIGELKARFLIEFFAKEIGPHAYNQGVDDAEAYFRAKLEDLRGTCFEPKD